MKTTPLEEKKKRTKVTVHS
ncbi:uncharacterized protein CELE_Y32F6B.9 [Caenorhabditis elegans]|uniref:Uncharacterized protein n=1 Tax=Caenorhabditis elegans TaxID=6239 RepID=A0A2K5ATY2_CAEEL|nr:Uncharacterized protein CELE_Y32F6B.9 [Caenorhabditis elegans]SPC47966.2 Uncharacterized protein CELE_Y32F6B.9 [Caenorhabditis elegans]|eukprot:NP_001348777.2 Uncharacterized protein CELE_Y32F6B.9 [Caenorhabditis elegans]